MGLVAAALMASSISANAADMPRKARPYSAAVPAAADPWVGYYVGLNLMAAWFDSKTDVLAPVVGTSTLSGVGATGGIQLGHNWVVDRKWLVGWETDLQLTSIDTDSTSVIGGITVQANGKVPFFGTLRGRVGYISDWGLVYVTGGLLYTYLKTNVVTSAGGNFSQSELQAGWTIGGGYERFFTNRISAKLEYLYLRPSDISVSAFGVSTTTHVDGHTVRLGVNYHM
jgi:outer membrane immunogenic protein